MTLEGGTMTTEGAFMTLEGGSITSEGGSMTSEGGPTFFRASLCILRVYYLFVTTCLEVTPFDLIFGDLGSK